MESFVDEISAILQRSWWSSHRVVYWAVGKVAVMILFFCVLLYIIIKIVIIHALDFLIHQTYRLGQFVYIFSRC